MLNTVLVPVDDDPCSAFCVQYAFDLSRLLGSRVVIMHVVTAAGDVQKGKALLERLGKGGRFPASLLLIEHDSVSDAILQVAQKHGVDLVLLGRPGCDLVLRPNGVREQLLKHSTVPLQVLPMTMKARKGFLERFQPGLQ